MGYEVESYSSLEKARMKADELAGQLLSPMSIQLGEICELYEEAINEELSNQFSEGNKKSAKKVAKNT